MKPDEDAEAAERPAEPQRRLRLYAWRDGSGEIRGTFLVREHRVLALWEESGLGEEVALRLPDGALPAVFRRYGKPLDAAVTPERVTPGDDDDQPLEVPLPGGGQARLWRFRFMPFGWVHPADYLLWECAGSEPVAAPAPLVASALSALARAAAG
jgi:hypothetical protein